MQVKDSILEVFRTEVFQTKTFSESSLTVTATITSGILGFLFYIVVARSLGPHDFGLLALSIAAFTLIVDIADLGLNTGLINFISQHLHQNKSSAYRFMKFGLETKIFMGFLVGLVGWVLSPIVAEKIFLKPDLILPLRLMMLGVLASLLFSFVTNSLQAFQKFWQWAGVTVFVNVLRLFIIIILISVLALNIKTVIFTYIGVLFIGFLMGLFLLPLRFLRISNEKTVAREFFHYNKWVAIFILLAAFSSRLDTFISGRLLSAKEVGIYSVAVQLTSSIPQIVFAIAAVIAPKLKSYNSDSQVLTYLKKVQLLVSVLALTGLLIIPISAFLIPIVYGSLYSLSVLPFIILFIAQLFFLMAIPAHQAIFYYFANPKIYVLFVTIQIIIVTLFGWFLIGLLGIVGAALAILLENIFIFVVPGLYVLNRFRKRKTLQ